MRFNVELCFIALADSPSLISNGSERTELCSLRLEHEFAVTETLFRRSPASRSLATEHWSLFRWGEQVIVLYFRATISTLSVLDTHEP